MSALVLGDAKFQQILRLFATAVSQASAQPARLPLSRGDYLHR